MQSTIQGTLDESRGYTSSTSRTARLCLKNGKAKIRQAKGDNQLDAAIGEQMFHVDFLLAGCEIGRH